MILVTGATGFLGRRVVRALAEAGFPVRALAHHRRHAAVIQGPGVEVVHGSIRDPRALAKAMQGVQGVVHLVAIIRQSRKRSFRSINNRGTAKVVAEAHKAGVSHFVHMSAIGTRDDPRFPYLQSKWQGERAVTLGAFPYTILRGSILFGEGDEFFNALAAVTRALPVVPLVGNGKALFQPMAAEDVAACIVRVFQEPAAYGGREIEIGGPQQFTYTQLMDMVQQTLGRQRLRARVPPAAMRLALGVMGRVVPRPPATAAMLDMLAIDNVTELDAVERNFGFSPRPVQGNIDYIRRLTYWDCLKTVLGFMPSHVRDH